MRVLGVYLVAMTVVWLGVLLAVVIPALTTGALGVTEAGTRAGQLFRGAVLKIHGLL
jgi:hypothetical protein